MSIELDVNLKLCANELKCVTSAVSVLSLIEESRYVKCMWMLVEIYRSWEESNITQETWWSIYSLILRIKNRLKLLSLENRKKATLSWFQTMCQNGQQNTVMVEQLIRVWQRLGSNILWLSINMQSPAHIPINKKRVKYKLFIPIP